MRHAFLQFGRCLGLIATAVFGASCVSTPGGDVAGAGLGLPARMGLGTEGAVERSEAIRLFYSAYEAGDQKAASRFGSRSAIESFAWSMADREGSRLAGEEIAFADGRRALLHAVRRGNRGWRVSHITWSEPGPEADSES